LFTTFQQLGDVRRDPPRLVAGEEVRRRATTRLLFEIGVDERLPVGVADDEVTAAPYQVCPQISGRVVPWFKRAVSQRRKS
jgi:hypothetical protein